MKAVALNGSHLRIVLIDKIPRLNLTQRFLVFFALTTLLPFLILGNLYLNQTWRTLNERSESKIKTAEVYIQQRVHEQCQQLKLIAEHVVSKDVLPFIPHPHAHSGALLRSDNDTELLLAKIQRRHHLAFIAVVSPDQKTVLANTNGFSDEILNKSTVLMTDSIRKKQSVVDTVKTEGRFDKNKILAECHRCRLLDIAVVPLISKSSSQVFALLVVGRQNILPSLGKLALKPILGTTAQMVDMPNDKKILGATNTPTSKTFTLRNTHRQEVGSLNVSIDVQRRNQIEQLQTHFFAWGLLILLFALAVIGFWFSKSFVEPLRSITDACHLVSHGNMDIRLPLKNTRGEMRQTILTVNRMLEGLSQTETMRRNFISTLSHDLKTPLLAQARVLSLIDENVESPVAKNMIEKLLKNNQQLLDMLITLLETYKQDNEVLLLHYETINLYELASKTIQLLQPLAEQKEITIDNQLPDALTCQADLQSIQRVIQNLVGNAIENIQRQGKIWITGESVAGNVVIAINDNGPGIEADYIPHMFDRYAGGLQRKKKVGSGLGLFIVKSIIQAHHGTIVVTSHPNELTQFKITLPLQQETA